MSAAAAVSIESTPSAGVSVTRATPVLKKSRPLAHGGLRAVLDDVDDRLHAELGHLHRILLAGGVDDTIDDVLHAGVFPLLIETTRTSSGLFPAACNACEAPYAAAVEVRGRPVHLLDRYTSPARRPSSTTTGGMSRACTTCSMDCAGKRVKR